MSQEFKLEDQYNPVRSFGDDIMDLIYFHTDRECIDTYLVVEYIVRRRNFLNGG